VSLLEEKHGGGGHGERCSQWRYRYHTPDGSPACCCCHDACSSTVHLCQNILVAGCELRIAHRIHKFAHAQASRVADPIACWVVHDGPISPQSPRSSGRLCTSPGGISLLQQLCVSVPGGQLPPTGPAGASVGSSPRAPLSPGSQVFRSPVGLLSPRNRSSDDGAGISGMCTVGGWWCVGGLGRVRCCAYAGEGCACVVMVVVLHLHSDT
jgi:hypothetical protein